VPDTIANIAIALAANPRAYVVLLGSGISSAAGIPTGYKVVEALIRRLATASGAREVRDPIAWYRAERGGDPTYARVIEELAPRAAERAGILRPFFEPTDAERHRGLKQPTEAHRALASLVERGLVQIILTTNFDPLVEMALDARGIRATVVRSGADIAGLPPLSQIRCLLVKVHGDYLDTRIRNTADEVAELDPEIAEYVTRVVHENGLLISGWSADYDLGLRDALRRATPTRYTAYWTSRRGLHGEADELGTALDAHRVVAASADTLFKEIAAACQSLGEMTGLRPLDDAAALRATRQALTGAGAAMELTELLRPEVDNARASAEPPYPTVMTEHEHFREWLAKLEEASQRLTKLCATIAYWGGPEHVEVVRRALERLSRWGIAGGVADVIAARNYPAVLAFYGAGVAAVAARRFDNLAHLLRRRMPHMEPRRPGDDDTLPTARVLNVAGVLDSSAINGVLNIGVAKRMDYHTPASMHIQAVLRPWLTELVSGQGEFEEAFDTFEALVALRFILDGGDDVPLGTYAIRGKRAFVGTGVPERLARELDREGASWGPIAGGIFSDEEEARSAIETLVTRLSRYQFI
jgi:hypothetical protein